MVVVVSNLSGFPCQTGAAHRQERVTADSALLFAAANSLPSLSPPSITPFPTVSLGSAGLPGPQGLRAWAQRPGSFKSNNIVLFQDRVRSFLPLTILTSLLWWALGRCEGVRGENTLLREGERWCDVGTEMMNALVAPVSYGPHSYFDVSPSWEGEMEGTSRNCLVPSTAPGRSQLKDLFCCSM